MPLRPRRPVGTPVRRIFAPLLLLAIGTPWSPRDVCAAVPIAVCVRQSVERANLYRYDIEKAGKVQRLVDAADASGVSGQFIMPGPDPVNPGNGSVPLIYDPVTIEFMMNTPRGREIVAKALRIKDMRTEVRQAPDPQAYLQQRWFEFMDLANSSPPLGKFMQAVGAQIREDLRGPLEDLVRRQRDAATDAVPPPTDPVALLNAADAALRRREALAAERDLFETDTRNAGLTWNAEREARFLERYDLDVQLRLAGEVEPQPLPGLEPLPAGGMTQKDLQTPEARKLIAGFYQKTLFWKDINGRRVGNKLLNANLLPEEFWPRTSLDRVDIPLADSPYFVGRKRVWFKLQLDHLKIWAQTLKLVGLTPKNFLAILFPNVRKEMKLEALEQLRALHDGYETYGPEVQALFSSDAVLALSASDIKALFDGYKAQTGFGVGGGYGGNSMGYGMGPLAATNKAKFEAFMNYLGYPPGALDEKGLTTQIFMLFGGSAIAHTGVMRFLPGRKQQQIRTIVETRTVADMQAQAAAEGAANGQPPADPNFPNPNFPNQPGYGGLSFGYGQTAPLVDGQVALHFKMSFDLAEKLRANVGTTVKDVFTLSGNLGKLPVWLTGARDAVAGASNSPARIKALAQQRRLIDASIDNVIDFKESVRAYAVLTGRDFGTELTRAKGRLNLSQTVRAAAQSHALAQAGKDGLSDIERIIRIQLGGDVADLPKILKQRQASLKMARKRGNADSEEALALQVELLTAAIEAKFTGAAGDAAKLQKLFLAHADRVYRRSVAPLIGVTRPADFAKATAAFLKIAESPDNSRRDSQMQDLQFGRGVTQRKAGEVADTVADPLSTSPDRAGALTYAPQMFRLDHQEWEASVALYAAVDDDTLSILSVRNYEARRLGSRMLKGLVGSVRMKIRTMDAIFEANGSKLRPGTLAAREFGRMKRMIVTGTAARVCGGQLAAQLGMKQLHQLARDRAEKKPLDDEQKALQEQYGSGTVGELRKFATQPWDYGLCIAMFTTLTRPVGKAVGLLNDGPIPGAVAPSGVPTGAPSDTPPDWAPPPIGDPGTPPVTPPTEAPYVPDPQPSSGTPAEDPWDSFPVTDPSGVPSPG